jgi:phage regulator Rha-like protein
MIDRDLADLYGVETKYLNRQVKRNLKRFPPEFMFQLDQNEKTELVTNWHRFISLKHSPRPPFVFTEHGIAMLSSVLNSEQAININIVIIKTFIKLKELMFSNRNLERRINSLEERVENQFELVMQEIETMKQIKNKPRVKIGYKISGQEELTS